jgi:small-conductance mechanosensitive channel
VNHNAKLGLARRRAAVVLSSLCLSLTLTCAQAQPAAKVAEAAPAAEQSIPNSVDVVINHRPVVTLRGPLLGRTPEQRAALSKATLESVLAKGGPAQVTLWKQDGTLGLQLDGAMLFYLQPADLNLGADARPEQLAQAAESVRQRLQLAVTELRERTDPRRLATGLFMAAMGVLVTGALIWGAFALRRQIFAWLRIRLLQWQTAHAGNPLAATYGQYGDAAARGAVTLLTWIVLVLVADLGLTFVLQQFSYTRPWAERTTEWGLNLLAQFASAAIGAVPGLLTAALIFFIARLVTRASAAFMERVERGDLVVGWLDRDTAGPTRRVGHAAVWLFALAMAYPFLPGASSEAFKGVSVLAGLMLSLGASGVVGQIVSGLSLMYSRTLRVGEYVKIGDTEGTVTAVGMFTLKIHTGLGEEVSLPNALAFSQPVHNYSRLVADGHFVLHTAVTIGYATPWRQVHAMLLEAARRTTGVAQDPAPYVMQTALSDFYVEYRLCAQGDRSAPRRRAEAINQLHANIQDVFNENGVQIMSPHYLGDPPQPQVVPPEAWSPDLAARARPASPLGK